LEQPTQQTEFLAPASRKRTSLVGIPRNDVSAAENVTPVSGSSSNCLSISGVSVHKRSWEVKNNASNRVSWGKIVRAQNLQPERPGESSPGIEFVINLNPALPSGAQLRDYEQACPGTADRIVRLLEKQVAADITRANRTEIFADIRRVLAIVAGFILVWYGHYWGAIAFVTSFAEVAAGRIRQAGANQKTIEQIMSLVGLEMNSVNKPGNQEANGDIERKVSRD
jgi:hypothetical protein